MKRKEISVFRSILLAILILDLLLFSSVSLAGDAKPELCYSKASPSIVHFGPQPGESPLILSVETKGPGGDISRVMVNLGGLLDAKYYDPTSDTIKDAGIGIPMWRVYEIEGAAAYLVGTISTSASIYREYRMVLTHERIKMDEPANATSRWQVELPNVGRTLSDFELEVVATNVFNQQDTASISLKVVDDCVAPEISAQAKYIIPSPVTRAGDRVTIEAEATDDLSGVFSVRLAEEGAEAIFGESADLLLTRQANSNLWKVQNTVASNVVAGEYAILLAAVDRAGNETIETVKVEVMDKISSLEIELSKGWNLISVPRALVNPAVEEVFAGVPVEEVRPIIAGQLQVVFEIMPGLGYLVKTSADAMLVVNFQDYDLSAIPLMIDLGKGWNLIGYVSQALKPKMPLTFYLGDTLKDEWLIVCTEEGEQARPQSISPYIWATDGFPTITGEPYSADNSDNLPAVELGKGYWIYLASDSVLVP